MIDLNRITLGATAGVVANLVIGGIGARLAMRAVALMTGGQPSVSVIGTAGILLLAAILGAALGVAVAYLHGWAGGRRRQVDWTIGGVLCVFVAALFFLNREGEGALLPAWQGALLFAPLALFSTLATGAVYERLRRRPGIPERRAPVTWVAGYAAAFILAFIGMMTLAGDTLRLPRIVWQMAALAGASANFADVYAPLQLLGLLFALAYLLLTWLLFWLADRRELQAAAVGCLLVAAGLFHSVGPAGVLLGRSTVAGTLEGMVALLGAAALTVVYWRLFTASPSGVRRTPPVVSLLLVTGAVGGIAIMMSLQPAWRVVNQPPFVTLFSVTFYLLPWLALPLGLLFSMGHELVHAAAVSAGPAALVDPSR